MNTTVLICSTDSYSDCWPAAETLIERYWPDCPWTLRTLSNVKPWGKDPLLVGPDTSWRQNLLAALDQIKTPFACLFLEDMLLARPVQTARCLEAEATMEAVENIGAIKLGNVSSEATEPFTDGYLFVDDDAEYRISTSATLWRVSYLRKILEGVGETAWDFECQGTPLSRTFPELILTTNDEGDGTRPIQAFYTAILRGKWIGECLEWLKTIGIEVADTSRGIGYLRDGFYHPK